MILEIIYANNRPRGGQNDCCPSGARLGVAERLIARDSLYECIAALKYRVSTIDLRAIEQAAPFGSNDEIYSASVAFSSFHFRGRLTLLLKNQQILATHGPKLERGPGFLFPGATYCLIRTDNE